MGKGDRKTAKGKRFNCSYGNVRTKAVLKTATTATASAVKGTGKNFAKKAAA